MIRRFVAPAGTPVRISELFLWLVNLLNPGFSLLRFRNSIASYFGAEYCFLISTGRAAMTLLLEAMKELAGNGRNEVIIPAYDCYSVPASIIKAGLRIRICDIDTGKLDYDYDKLNQIDCSNVLCILSANLFGIPNNMERLQSFAQKNSILLIDDAAQAMGARSGGKYSGTWGDAGMFSLDKGKNITSVQGGILITNSTEIAAGIEDKLDKMKGIGLFENLLIGIKILIYSIFLNPLLYWIPNSFPFLKLGTTEYTTDFPVQKYSRFLAAFAILLFHRLSKINTSRIQIAEKYKKELGEFRSILIPSTDQGVDPVYLRFPIILKTAGIQEQVIESLKRKGIGASGSYPESVFDINQIHSNVNMDQSSATNGKSLARRIVTLPTTPYVSDSDIRNIREIFGSLESEYINLV